MKTKTKIYNLKSLVLAGIYILFLSCLTGANINAVPSMTDNERATSRPDSSELAIFGPPDRVCAGVNIHFTGGHEKELDMIASAGLKYIRTDFIWQDIESSKGIYNWADYDELTSNLNKRGLRALYILDYSNSLYEDTVVSKDPLTGEEIKDIAAPVRPESVAAFSRWAAAAANRYKDQHIVWEIWNEPNVSYWRPAANVDDYIRLSKAVGEAVKSADPGSVLIGPGVSQIPFPFLESFMASGVLKYLDGVSVHPYRDYSLPPESVASDYLKIADLIAKYAPEGKKNIPVVSSEWGYASCPKGVTTEIQAAYAVRMQLANLLSGVPVSIWYDWKNDGESVTNFEHNCGTVTFDLAPKPAYNAIRTMNDQLKGLSLTHRIGMESNNDWALLFMSREGIFKICVWTTDKPHSAKLDITLSHTKGLSATDGYGNSLELKTGKNELILDLNELPKYITLPCGIRLN